MLVSKTLVWLMSSKWFMSYFKAQFQTLVSLRGHTAKVWWQTTSNLDELYLPLYLFITLFVCRWRQGTLSKLLANSNSAASSRKSKKRVCKGFKSTPWRWGTVETLVCIRPSESFTHSCKLVFFSRISLWWNSEQGVTPRGFGSLAQDLGHLPPDDIT